MTVADGKIIITYTKGPTVPKDLCHVIATREGSDVKLRYLDGDDPASLWLPKERDRIDELVEAINRARKGCRCLITP